MSVGWALYARELEHYFVTPIAYVVIGAFWAASGFFFSFNALFVSAVDMVTAFHNMSLLLMLIAPLLSMRTFAEERQNHTMELLMTLPCSELQLVLAKYIALLTVVIIMLAGSSGAVVVLAWFAEPDYGPIIAGYIGVFLLAAAFCAIGILASALASNQIVAAVCTWITLLAGWFIDYTAALAPGSYWVLYSQHLSFSIHYLDLIRGLLSNASVVYFLSIVALCTTAATQVLQAKRY